MAGWRGQGRGWNPVAAGLALATLAAVIGCGETPTPTVNPVAPELQAGQRVFAQYCNTCHPRGHLGAGPSLIDLPYADQQMADQIRHGRSSMPGFGPDRISDSELQSLIDYIRTLK